MIKFPFNPKMCCKQKSAKKSTRVTAPQVVRTYTEIRYVIAAEGEDDSYRFVYNFPKNRTQAIVSSDPRHASLFKSVAAAEQVASRIKSVSGHGPSNQRFRFEIRKGFARIAVVSVRKRKSNFTAPTFEEVDRVLKFTLTKVPTKYFIQQL